MYFLLQSTSKQNTIFSHKGLGLIVLLLFTLNLTGVFTPENWATPTGNDLESPKKLYLIDKAGLFVSDLSSFEAKIRKISQQLQIAPEWLMAVIHTESRFNRCAYNKAGSQAFGLLQWMPRTINEYGIQMKELQESSEMEQLDYVHQYFKKMKRLAGTYNSLTDLYLAVLYPKALRKTENECYPLYSYPSKAYDLNRGLDMDKDGAVTISDIEEKLQIRYPEAFQVTDASKQCASEKPSFVFKDFELSFFGS